MNFKLEALLKLNKSKEDLVMRELGRINSHLQDQKQRSNFMLSIADERIDARNGRLQEGMDIGTLALYDNFFQGVKIQNAKQNEVISEVQTRLENTRTKLVEAMRKRKTLEILKDKELRAEKSRQTKRELKEMDEIAANSWRLHNN
ncbi:MAG: flagellar export protein FliJ [Nitrospinae bacterium CG11_big_fil_rev_8_21_14_0_20_45_15]|nr:MAG: flagellar export protein FliJ [Nitrospinae bacterium CG11_big_fil_rev_8_21_14_0_20_45_15]